MKKQYSAEYLDKKHEMLRTKVQKAVRAQYLAERAMDNLKKNKNLWNQMSEHCGFAVDSDYGDWSC